MRQHCKSMTLALALVLLMPSEAFARRRAVGGGERMKPIIVAGAIHVAIAVDLRDVIVDGSPAVLGAYVASVTFDRTKIAYVETIAGTDPLFAEAFHATNAQKANADGIVKVAGVQTSRQAPSGMVHPATVIFRQIAAGGISTIRARVESIATTNVTANGELALRAVAHEEER